MDDIVTVEHHHSFEMGALAPKKIWVDWIDEKILPPDVTGLPVESIPFIPSPRTPDVPLLALPSDFTDHDLALPRAFQRDPSKLTALARFNGELLLARLRIALDRGHSFNEEEWAKLLRLSISIPTIRQIFPTMPAGLVRPTPDSAFPQTMLDYALKEGERIDAVVDWVINHARSLPKNEVVASMFNRLSPSSGTHVSVRNYLNARRPRAFLPDLTSLTTDLYVSRTATSASARAAAIRTLRPALEEVRTAMRELGEYAMPVCRGTWGREELDLVMMAIVETGGRNGRMTKEELDDFLDLEGRRSRR